MSTYHGRCPYCRTNQLVRRMDHLDLFAQLAEDWKERRRDPNLFRIAFHMSIAPNSCPGTGHRPLEMI